MTAISSTEIDFKAIGYLAYAYCGYELKLEVLQSKGFYIGTLNDGLPCSRESKEYFRTHQQASAALASGDWTQRQYP